MGARQAEPLVSVIIPTFNREKTIRASIESVLQQTYQNLDVLVIDDGSTDQTNRIIDEIKDSRVQYIRSTENGGACKARNIGISYAKGEYIAFQDSDDQWLPDKLRKQMQAIDISGADLCFCKLIIKKGNKEIELQPKEVGLGMVTNRKSLFGASTQTILGKKTVFEKVRFDEEMPRLQDFDLLLRIYGEFKIYCLDEGLVRWNEQEDSITNNNQKFYDAVCRIIEKYPDFKKDNLQTTNIISKILIQYACEEQYKRNKEYAKYLQLAMYLSSSMKNISLIILVLVKLYRPIKSIYYKCITIHKKSFCYQKHFYEKTVLGNRNLL